jgi:hypothetical protein
MESTSWPAWGALSWLAGGVEAQREYYNGGFGNLVGEEEVLVK